jgi:hypothetical protein
VFSQAAVRPAQEGMETPRRRAITISPRAGATIVLSPAGETSDRNDLVAATAA